MVGHSPGAVSPQLNGSYPGLLRTLFQCEWPSRAWSRKMEHLRARGLDGVRQRDDGTQFAKGRFIGNDVCASMILDAPGQPTRAKVVARPA